ncbi:MAG: hypothetical protein IPL08_04900 [Saprospiraceae bacterium]|nr:hypothetical protein [Saprospiraceae bacterium]
MNVRCAAHSATLTGAGARVRCLITCKVERLKGASVGIVRGRPCIYQIRSYLSACIVW